MVRLTVGLKLRCITGLALALLGAIAGAGHFGASRSSATLAELSRSQELLQKSVQVDANHDTLRGDVYFALFADDANAIGDIATAMSDRIEGMRADFHAIATLAELDSRPTSDALRVAFHKARPKLNAYLEGARRMQDALRAGKEQARSELVRFERSFTELVEPMQAMSDSISGAAADASTEAAGANDSMAHWMWGIFAFSVLVLIVAARRLASSVLRAITNLRCVLDAMAKKRFDVRAEVQGDDELADIGRSANQTIDAMNRAVHEISAGAKRLAASSESMQSVATRMAGAASRTHDHATRVARTSDEMRANCESTAAGGGQMRASIEEISHRCIDAADAAQDAVRSAAAARQSMEALVAKSGEIGEVVRFISSIAEQTNLLALNATIESARAGESGRGFAVVANEVKSLALETARSTNVVREKVAAIQDETRKVGELIGTIDGVIQRIDGIQGTIAGAIQEQTATTSEMAENMSAVSAGASGIKGSIDEVATHAQVASEASNEVASASTEVSKIADEMGRLVSEFRVTIAG